MCPLQWAPLSPYSRRRRALSSRRVAPQPRGRSAQVCATPPRRPALDHPSPLERDRHTFLNLPERTQLLGRHHRRARGQGGVRKPGSCDRRATAYKLLDTAKGFKNGRSQPGPAGSALALLRRRRDAACATQLIVSRRRRSGGPHRRWQHRYLTTTRGDGKDDFCRSKWTWWRSFNAQHPLRREVASPGAVFRLDPCELASRSPHLTGTTPTAELLDPRRAGHALRIARQATGERCSIARRGRRWQVLSLGSPRSVRTISDAGVPAFEGVRETWWQDPRVHRAVVTPIGAG